MQRSLNTRLHELERRAQAGGPVLVADPDRNPPRYRIDGRAVSPAAFGLALPSARAVIRVRREVRVPEWRRDEAAE